MTSSCAHRRPNRETMSPLWSGALKGRFPNVKRIFIEAQRSWAHAVGEQLASYLSFVKKLT